jgi:hypothetical protein
MYEIRFRYRDETSGGKWREQSCRMKSVEQCVEIYGLADCDHEILSVVDLSDRSAASKFMEGGWPIAICVAWVGFNDGRLIAERSDKSPPCDLYTAAIS